MKVIQKVTGLNHIIIYADQNFHQSCDRLLTAYDA